jgi:hypothetical protein
MTDKTVSHAIGIYVSRNLCVGIYVSDGTGTFRKLFPQSTGPVLRINSGVRGIEAALDVDGPYIASDDIQGIYRIAFAVQH